ncbi:MAG: DNA repair protein RecN [Deltaproteobacteria bacterium]|nr:DNA repair protein RecN [Deltaproteobacteria bacterium]
MLIELSIKDFAIIDSLAIGFGPGLNVFTGETGAGKSIIIDAIALILGDRASNDLIRTNKEEALVEALFNVAGNKGIEAVLGEAGILFSDNLVIKRVVQKAGRNKIYINGSLATLVTLMEVGRRLIDIYGQSEHQSLTRPEEHIEILDSFGGFQKLRVEMSDAYKHYANIKKELDALVQNPKTSAERMTLLNHQVKEINDAALRPGLDADLKREYERLRNAERIKGAVVSSERVLYSDNGSVVERVGSVVKNLKEVSSLDDKLAKAAATLETNLFQMEDVARFLMDYSKSIEADPNELENLGARLDQVVRLIKKWGPTIEEVLAKKTAFEKEVEGFSHVEDRIKELEGECGAAKDNASVVAAKLSEARIHAATELKGKLEAELATLGMKGTVFEARLETDKNADGGPRPGEKGADRVNFFISPNPGEAVKPLSKIASGGELSRIMLAMKSVTALGRIPSLVFDEIDTGVSGAMAQVVGLKLNAVSRIHQVLCITHLPQIAAFADKHFAVAKRPGGDGRTVTVVKELNPAEAVDQISVMLGGVKVTDVTKEHAMELIEASRAMAGKRKK